MTVCFICAVCQCICCAYACVVYIGTLDLLLFIGTLDMFHVGTLHLIYGRLGHNNNNNGLSAISPEST